METKPTVIYGDANDCASKTNCTESAHGIYPSQWMDVWELRQKKFKDPKENNEMLQG